MNWNKILLMMKDDQIRFIESYQGKLDDLFQISLQIDNPLAWRSCFFLSYYLKKHPDEGIQMILKWISLLPKTKESHQREIFRILLLYPINTFENTQVYDFCVNTWTNPTKKPAIRLYAIKILLKFADKYPQFYQEIQELLTPIYTQSLTKGIQHSLLLIMKDQKINKHLKFN